ncbi:MAG: hypothetical protein GY845_25485 [Planctomycetes bacterium]|nr:hypothetical protein [Planctomycetota bacterium]
MNEDDLFAILIGGDPFRLVQTLWKQDLEIALGMTHPIVTATAMAMATAVCNSICNVPNNLIKEGKRLLDDIDNGLRESSVYCGMHVCGVCKNLLNVTSK